MSRDDMILLVGGSRVGGDEPVAEYVPKDVVTRSSWQGGYLTLDCSLSRRAKTVAMEQMYTPVREVTPEGETTWSGFLMRPDARTVNGSHQTQSLSAIGWAGAKAERRKDVKWLGIDRDLSNWRAAPRLRREVLLQGNNAPRDAEASEGRLRFDGSGTWASAPGAPAIESLYVASPLNVGMVLWGAATAANMQGSDWTGSLFTANADGSAGSAVGSDWISAALGGYTGSLAYAENGPQTIPTNAKAVGLQVYSTLATAPDTTRHLELAALAVLGDHGLTLHGTNADDYGLLASDCIRYLIDKFGGGELRAGHIPDSPFHLPHTGLTDWTTLGEAVNALNVFHGFTSAIWDRGEWDFHEFGQSPRSRTWVVSASDPGVEFNEAGNDGAAIFDRVLVTFQDPSGQQMSVGPEGSTADAFDDRLQIWDPANPAVQAGEARCDRLELGLTVVPETAIRAGEVYLSQLNQSRRAGTARIPHEVMDAATGQMVRTEFIKGGDHLIVTDFGDDTPRRIPDVEHRDRAANLTLDDSMQHADQLLAHLQVNRVGR